MQWNTWQEFEVLIERKSDEMRWNEMSDKEEKERMEVHEIEKQRRNFAIEWERNPVRGCPVAGTGKHHAGRGRRICTLRWRGGQWGGKLIGSKRSFGECVVADIMVRDLMRLRDHFDSDVEDGTIEGFEREIEEKLKAERKYQERSN